MKLKQKQIFLEKLAINMFCFLHDSTLIKPILKMAKKPEMTLNVTVFPNIMEVSNHGPRVRAVGVRTVPVIVYFFKLNPEKI